ncbi:MAG: glycerol-3-phosphate 1-O-acyltransferase PlsY [Fimbriimonadia bacterium]|jgi:glycerol-3-phosphate acyltransferase PlsY
MGEVDSARLLQYVGFVVGGFLLGSLPFGFWLCKLLKGVDIRTVGSGNIGATNVFRCAGPLIGTVVLLLDVAKGFMPAVVGRMVAGPDLAVAAGAAAVLGHTFSPFLGFRGGKGVAAALGLLLGATPGIAGGALASFAVVFAVTRWVSLASLLGALSAAVLVLVIDSPTSVRALILVIAVLLIVNHRANIRRLLRGEEPKFRFGGSKAADAAHTSEPASV